MATTTTALTANTKRHPIRGALWGLLLGIGAALFLIGQKVIAFGTITPWIVIGAGAIVGLIWAFVAPPKQGREAPPPVATTPVVPIPSEPTEPLDALDAPDLPQSDLPPSDLPPSDLPPSDLPPSVPPPTPPPPPPPAPTDPPPPPPV